MRLNYFSFLIFFLIFFSFQKTALTASHVKVNAGKCIKGDCVNGKGTFDDGVRLYEGEFKDGKYHGQGSSKRHDNGVTYQGEWKNNKPISNQKKTHGGAVITRFRASFSCRFSR